MSIVIFNIVSSNNSMYDKSNISVRIIVPNTKSRSKNKKKNIMKAKANIAKTTALSSRVSGLLRSPWGLAVVVAVALVGIWVVLSTQAAPIVLTPVSGRTSTCGATVTNYSYKVPFGNAPWNIPACKLPVFSQSDDYVSRLFNHAIPNSGTELQMSRRGYFTFGFGFGDAKSSFSKAVYTKDEAGGKTIKVRVCGSSHCNPSNLDGELSSSDPKGYLPDREIPWGSSWSISEGGDNEIVILDPATGELITLSQVKKSTGNALGDIASGATGQCGIVHPERLCVASARILRDHTGKVANYFTYEGSQGARGAGIPNYATMLTPQEVAAGEIRHALGIGIFNTAIGPACSASQLASNDWNIIGKQCGTAFAPASKYEWLSALKVSDRSGGDAYTAYDTSTPLSQTIPEGMRFVLRITDGEIDSFIKSKNYTGAKANTAKIIIRALRDYGFMPVDTGGSASFQVSGVLNPTNKELWSQLGITQDSDKKLLQGLFTEHNMVALDPPISNCIDGTKSKFYCKYDSSRYVIEGSITPEPSTTSTPTPTTSTVPPTVTPTQSPGTNPTPTPTPTADKIPPTEPIKIKRSLVLDPLRVAYNLQLKWQASTDVGSGVKDYLVTRQDGKSWTTISPIFTDNTVVANQVYKYEIKARDKANNISVASSASAKAQCLLIWCWLE